MSQSMLHAVEPILTRVVDELRATDAALILSPDDAAPPTLLTKVGRLTTPGWEAILRNHTPEQGLPHLLSVPLPQNSAATRSISLCLYAQGRKSWSEREQFACQVIAGAIAGILTAGGDGDTDNTAIWPQVAASQRILTVNEEELCRIVLDIHDGPVQKLFAALNLLDHAQVTFAPAADPKLIDSLQRVAHMLEDAMREIRTFLGAFRPPEFAERDLLDVLEGLIIQQEQYSGITVHLQTGPALPPVTVPVKIALYRIVQEALANIQRHAEVDECFVNVWPCRDHLCLEVIDHGKGFRAGDGAARAGDGQHIGLRGMRDRINLVGGKLWVESNPGQGVTIHVEAPIDG